MQLKCSGQRSTLPIVVRRPTVTGPAVLPIASVPVPQHRLCASRARSGFLKSSSIVITSECAHEMCALTSNLTASLAAPTSTRPMALTVRPLLSHHHRSRVAQGSAVATPGRTSASRMGLAGTRFHAWKRRAAAAGGVPDMTMEAVAVADDAPYLGRASDMVAALEALCHTRTFTEMCTFLQNNSHMFRGPEVAALVLQASRVALLDARRRAAVAMTAAEQGAAELVGGQEERSSMIRKLLAGAVDDVLGTGASPGSGGGSDVLDELDAADQLLGWATPLLKNHIKRYPPDAIAALVTALAQLQQYDMRLMELAAESFKSDPGDWLRRAAEQAAKVPDEVVVAEDGNDDDSSTVYDPWFNLMTFVGSFSRLGHYDRQLMAAVAKEAVELIPLVAARAEAEDAVEMETGLPGGQGGFGGIRATDSVVTLVTAFLELNYLDPPFMQAAGEYLTAFSHQLGADAAADVLLAFATFNARNPVFYSLLLRRLVEAAGGVTEEGDEWEEEGEWGEEQAMLLSPRATGAMYRACVLISAMGDVPELSPPSPPPPTGSVTAPKPPSNARSLGHPPSDEGKGGDGKGEGQATSGSAESRLVARSLSSLLRASLLRFPMSAMQVNPQGRPTPAQLEQAAEVPGMLEALEVAGLLTVPQILSILQTVPGVEPLPPAELTALAASVSPSALAQYGKSKVITSAGVADDDIIGGANAGAWVRPDALFLYDNTEFSLGPVSAIRVAVKALDENLHCCRNVGVDLDSEPDRPGPRSTKSATGSSRTPTTAPRPVREVVGGTVDSQTPRRQGRLLRLRGAALSELRCLEAWGWRVLVVPVGVWGAMNLEGRRTWLIRQLNELAADAAHEDDSLGLRTKSMRAEIWV